MFSRARLRDAEEHAWPHRPNEKDGDVDVTHQQRGSGGSQRTRRRTPVLVGLGATVTLLLTACSSPTPGSGSTWDLVSRGWLPGADDVASINPITRSLWVGSWIAALAIGIVVWGLTFWVIVRYRRRKGETGLPPQLRYYVPMEVLYTIVPLFMVGVLFFYTARDQAEIEARYPDPAVNIEVVGKRWAWDFNYRDEDVYETSAQVPMQAGLSDEQVEAEIPTLYMPVGQSAEITIHSRDVIHSFFVPAFTYKKDMVPGRTNYMSVTPEREGVYSGKCAELCGEYHSAMLFNVAVVSQAEYDEQMSALRARGQTGALDVDLGPSDLAPNQIGLPTGQKTETTG